jgi:hypothetical protein
LWLAAHTVYDVTTRVTWFGAQTDRLLTAIRARAEYLASKSLARPELLVGCFCLLVAPGGKEWKVTTKDPSIDALFERMSRGGSAPSGDTMRLEGRAERVRSSTWATVLLAISGMLFLRHVARAALHFVLKYDRQCELVLEGSALRVRTKTEMLGKTLSYTDMEWPASGIVRLGREERYPRIGFYAGLSALAVGTVLGVWLFVDGVRAASPSLLLWGALFVAGGVLADFALVSLLPSAKGSCRLVLVPAKGQGLSVIGPDAERIDAFLKQLARAV